MRRGFRVTGLLIGLVFLASCGGPEQPRTDGIAEPASAPADTATDKGPDLEAIANGDHRPDKNKARNAFRHPVETLQFFGLRPDSHVMEIWPAAGWYTEVIAPYVNESGRYYAAHWDPESDIEFIRKGVEGFNSKLAEHPDLYGNVKMAVLMHPDHLEPVPPESVDLVLTFRNVHNWMGRGFEDDIFKLAYDALKPGGVLGIVEHRGDASVPQDPKAASGYVNEKYVIDLAERAGFALVDTSQVNANPKDTKDYKDGVWTLPPTFRAGEEDLDKYVAIGESDRFTLKFVKPLKSS